MPEVLPRDSVEEIDVFNSPPVIEKVVGQPPAPLVVGSSKPLMSLKNSSKPPPMQSKNPSKISNSGPVTQIQSRQQTSGDNDSGNLGTAKTQHSPYNANRNSKAPLQTLASRQNKVNTIDYVSSNVSNG